MLFGPCLTTSTRPVVGLSVEPAQDDGGGGGGNDHEGLGETAPSMRHFPTMGKGLVPCGVFDTLSGHPGRSPCPPVTRKWRLWLVPPDYGEKPTKARRRGDLQIAGIRRGGAVGFSAARSPGQ